MPKIVYIDPLEVKLLEIPYPRDVAYQRILLNKQGQIVPLVAMQDEDGNWSIDNSDYSSACAQIKAAELEGWPTVILTDSDEDT